MKYDIEVVIYVVNKIGYANESSSEVKALLWASNWINIVVAIEL
jgi:hypothetical protein